LKEIIRKKKGITLKNYKTKGKWKRGRRVVIEDCGGRRREKKESVPWCPLANAWCVLDTSSTKA
jgi:uncharacterized protein Veg